MRCSEVRSCGMILEQLCIGANGQVCFLNRLPYIMRRTALKVNAENRVTRKRKRMGSSGDDQ